MRCFMHVLLSFFQICLVSAEDFQDFKMLPHALQIYLMLMLNYYVVENVQFEDQVAYRNLAVDLEPS